MFGIRENNLQLAAPDGFGHVIGVKPRKTAPSDGGGVRRADRVDGQPRMKLHNARYAGACDRREAPRIETEIREGYDFMRRELSGFGNPWMAREIVRRADHDPADFGSDARRNQG